MIIILGLVGALIIEYLWSPRIELVRGKDYYLFFNSKNSRKWLKLF
jgi:hypothetical protein